MNILFTKQQAHDEIECIFRELLPQNGMAQRPEQIRLCHSMLDAMLDGSIALCDAGTGIGKTFAYLVAGIMLEKYEQAPLGLLRGHGGRQRSYRHSGRKRDLEQVTHSSACGLSPGRPLFPSNNTS